MSQSAQLKKRLRSLEAHLSQENPILLRAVASFRKLDKIAHGLGILDKDASYATQISWWPMVAVLGTYSSGKSTFINHFLGQPLQLTGNQAVDDRFTIVSYSHESEAKALPGLALDADPRFPFFNLSRSIEGIAAGEGRRIDAYLQLKTCRSEKVRGKILVDSPGFDADSQRDSTLRITDHIIDLSDLVLVFFDARHPEAGTMRDTLDHLVARTINRPDSSKFLYVLNQIDTTAREDNPEDVIASWQRALAQKGLIAGRFYRIYNPDAAVPIDDETLRLRYETKRDVDLHEIHTRMGHVGVDRAYRVVGVIEQTAHGLLERFIPKLQTLLAQWRREVIWLDTLVFGVILTAVLIWTFWTGTWEGMRFSHPTWSALWNAPERWKHLALGVVIGLIGYGHLTLRQLAARDVLAKLDTEFTDNTDLLSKNLPQAFQKSTGLWRSIFLRQPAGWGPRARRRVSEVQSEANAYVQDLNDRFTDPSGTEIDPDAF